MPSVLFFGRADCEQSKKALDHLKQCQFNVTSVISNGRGESLPEFVNAWSGDYIFCFRSLFILPKTLIDRAEIAAVNFHPAPPEYPGSACINFALYDQSQHYGVTAHIMNEKIDNGAILQCERFPILPQDDLESLLAKTHVKLGELFFNFIDRVVAGGAEFIEAAKNTSRDVVWSGEARKMEALDQLQVIPPDISKEVLERIIRATYTENFPPKIVLHGYEFVLKLQDSE